LIHYVKIFKISLQRKFLMLRNPNFLYKSFHECKDYSIFFTYDTLLHALAANGKLHAPCPPAGGQAGFSKTRSHRVRQLTDPSLQIPAKADNQKRWKRPRQPAGWQAWCI
jgi:hypothetical protein